jgi:ferric iron reductase protein FhuF
VTAGLDEVLASVHSRVDYLRAVTERSPEDDWYDCDAITSVDLDRVIDDVSAGDRQVTASLLAQSYAHRVAAVSLAAYAVGLPWPSAAAADTSVRLAGGRAKALLFHTGVLGEPDDTAGLAEAIFAAHLVPFVSTVRESQRLGERLIWANVAASCAAAFRAVEGSARDRGDADERTAIRRRADEFIEHAKWLDGTGYFEPDSSDWGWQRTACCLWYRTSGGRTCAGCSLNREEPA